MEVYVCMYVCMYWEGVGDKHEDKMRKGKDVCDGDKGGDTR